ncbi:hypothetical protein DXG01_010532 [Tephrocybe rancida]|nr:hypothetical protein DXG01_010532 [Tephrocybe rancida]
MDDEDSIELEALQAQIDMSMAFAQEMVSSWVKPSRKLPGKSNRDVEAELKEYMRRPPRLGVGAAVPENANASRDTVRLKGQLVGKGNKRLREDELEPKEKEKSDDEGESRGAAIKKKARVDPFGDNKKKKKNKAESTPLAPPKSPTLLMAEKAELDEVVSMVTEGVAGPSTPTATPNRKKRRKKHRTLDPSADTAQITSPPISPQALKTNTPALPLNIHAPEPATTPPKLKVVDVSLTTTPATPLQLRRQAQSAALLQQPLLNLDPASDDESEHEDDAKSDIGGGSAKKKRRRRKKKKKKTDANASAMEVPVAAS